MPISPFIAAINQICDEKGLQKKEVVSAIEQAIAAAYRKDYGNPREMIRTELEENNGKFKVFQEFEVVNKKEYISKEEAKALKGKQASEKSDNQENTKIIEPEKTASENKTENIEEQEPEIKIFDPAVHIYLKEAKKLDSKAKVGDLVKINLPYKDNFGRIASQTAKQVIVQRLREAERNMLFAEYKQREGEIASGTVQQIEGRNIILNIGKTSALLPSQEQIAYEHYYIGQRLRIFIKEVAESHRGPRIIVSRSHPELLSGLFKLEVPEINSEQVKIKAIAREPGSRSKVAISTQDKQLDPIGTCVGQRGSRIAAVLAELGDEKIDIIVWDKNPKKFLQNALSPASIEKITLSKDKKTATVKVADDQLPLAIGKNGQNVRLASKITGIEIDIIKPRLDARKTINEKKTIPPSDENKKPAKIEKEIIKPQKSKH
ncbi:MAG: N utilization substance protein A [Candidatus Berkelbacteria bacterium Licking1014_7]|uniref:Transcription termination/antitermination protein NusA n=1 Tax=Candidatus Berkelbacteria bacterium Licking1014_7 TaxID=2017147 RepID=A0A554LJ76_9BACT|nr:MAG: N utilization substance protein A [Candidatus Berkelbacteria bacterium Licking1014_7]